MLTRVGYGWGLGLLIASICIGAAAAAEPSYDRYKSWFVACDNGLSCEARGFEEGTNENPDLRFTRPAGPAAEAAVVISVPSEVARSDLRIDEKPLNLPSPAWTVERQDGFTVFSTQNAQALARFVAGARNAAKLQVGEATVIPLDGMAAALLRMDERQGRLGGVTALIRKGRAPASEVPPPPPLPGVPEFKPAPPLAEGQAHALVERARQAEAERLKSEDCQDDTPQDIDFTAAYPLDDRNALVILSCAMGAYQGWSLVSIVPRAEDGSPTPFRPSFPIRQEIPTDSLTEPYFDPKTGILMTSAKGRGLADCGMTAEWIWNGQEFQLTSASYQANCGGSEPGDWPVVFRSK
ncbi:Protein of unknown function [Faunimonas pinastri]|uniref:DUF1176 domain-containing protein n=1 Tax=Faunimonas pinastri TaxID=1855383 RepID=A0A1H9D9L4_9HYPH|nr:DUF1176 domain-containing protein [Faunimonas pinastri]SEQ09458.1 Protein of unknown function [Faunimonas pinastri]